MYGLEEQKGKKFDFDLEVEIKKNTKKKQEILANADKEIKNIKSQLAAKSEHGEKLGIFLHAYEALSKVINKIK